MSSGGRRIEGDVERGEPFEFLPDGEPVRAYRGETVAAALLAVGRRRTRTTRRGEWRGLYCGMGLCFECIMVVDGRPNVRACTTPALPGMRVETQRGPGNRMGPPG